jgi:hypothetical protein
VHEDFFVLYRDHDGGAHAGWLRRVSIVSMVLAVVVAALIVGLQGTVAQDARFEYGTIHEYEGVLVGEPVPLLVTSDRTYFLVNPFKHGFKADVASGSAIRLEAALIERDEQAMLEVVEGSVVVVEGASGALPDRTDLGPVVLRGEIVDSKCYLGVMNPGHLKPHRACAVNCLRGGIPAVLLTRLDDGSTRQTVLVGPPGAPLRDWILSYVAEPVQVTGELERVGSLEVLTVEAAGIERLDREDQGP